MERKQRIKNQMKKIRQSNIIKRKEENLTRKLKMEAEQLTNPLRPFRNPRHIPFETIEIEVSEDFPTEGSVEYKFGNRLTYAEILEKSQVGKEKLIDVARIRIVALQGAPDRPKETTKCILKNNRLLKN